MQNSLDRIFEGLENTLRTVVGPTVTDPYILSQVTSVAEILSNLSTRVQWSSAQLLDVTDRVRPILELAARNSPDHLPRTATVLAAPAPAAATDNAELVAARDAHLFALREVQRRLEIAPDAAVDAAVRDFLDWQVVREASLLRTGSFSKPKQSTREKDVP